MVGNRRYKIRERRKIPLGWLLFGGLFFCLAGGAGYFLFFSPFFQVAKIEVNQLKDISASEIKQIAQNNLSGKTWFFLPQQSIVLAPISQIRQGILDKFSEVGLVEINKNWQWRQSSLMIKIKERENKGIWCRVSYQEKPMPLATSTDLTLATSTPQLERQIHQCFHFDQEGIIFRPSLLVSGGLVLNLFSEQSADLRAKVASPEVINFILEAKKELAKINIAIMDFEIVSAEDLKAATSQGWQIYFDPTHSLTGQINALQLVLEKEIKETRASLEYIDLRIEGRVYYK